MMSENVQEVQYEDSGEGYASLCAGKLRSSVCGFGEKRRQIV